MIELSTETQEKNRAEIGSKWLTDFDLIELYQNWDKQAQVFWEELAQQYRQPQSPTTSSR